MVTMYKVAFTEWWIQISGVMMDMMSKTPRMIYIDFMDFIHAL